MRVGFKPKTSLPLLQETNTAPLVFDCKYCC